ncbi:putative late blight resistance protein homolog R1A-10 [Salvia miltiorrhiza]|uniref:putative late blight resistance protein homolog R1A-10 n=1 Tax=Salvia miltiorrhiza TaxID=226208 RepID=UPI0025AD1F94|nr:putative late blight resistance protein homolog R1A-10 [Salvia miltiorrhiza]
MLTTASSTRSALKSEDDDFHEDLTVATQLAVSISNRLGRLAERIKWTAVGSSSRSSPTSKDIVVGFDEDRLQILSWLRSYSSELQVLPIVGMGGIGKSTLAKIVYDDTFMTYHFDFHAWVTISKDYSVESILSNLLASMKGKGIQAESDLQCEEKESEIYKYLKGRRYLIVMDDMWSTVAWDQVRRLLPDDNNGSRILLTTRLKNVATYTSSMSPIHTMRFLDDQQSWRLFQKKVFGDQDCPVELQDIGKKYVKRCEGLPLSIVTVAGLLSKIDRTPKLWKRIGANDGQLETILLSLSYKHLPRHLRECFLYMAGFPKEYEIRVSELIKLWVAEGFLEGRDESKTLEEVAEDVLEVLVEQSLVLVTSKKSDGKIKRCKLHNVVRDFCSRQAGEEKFLLPIMDYFPNPIVRRHFLPQVLQNHQRISVSWCDLDLKDSTHSSCTRSIICISQRGYRPKGSIENFKSLKVLHVLHRNDHAFWDLGQVFDLIHLTYLASNIPSSIVPSAISKLHNLQTLIIYRSEVSLPKEIWRLWQLRHLIAFSFLPLPDPSYSYVKNIQTLSLATNFVFSESMVDKIPNIRKLEICYSFVTFGPSPKFYNVRDLHRLEKLKLVTRSSFQMCPTFNFPGSLKKLELSGWRLPWTNMLVLGQLPSLQVLKLKNHACYGEHWKTIEGGFVNLRVLHIDESNLQNWTTESSHFPRLQRLMLHRCPYLSEIPVDIGKIPTLEQIEIDDLNPSLLYSATQIREKRDALQVSLKRFLYDLSNLTLCFISG